MKSKPVSASLTLRNKMLILPIVVAIVSFGMVGGQLRAQLNTAGYSSNKWPHMIPCRIHEGSNPDLFVMTLGDVKTPLADGMFNPAKDEVILNDGTVIKNYYRDSLGIKYYKPIDKTRFQLPPSGWCSWYYYYQDVNEKEIERNAKWVADNLKPFGARYIQIDDGWQGTGHGAGSNRDWTTINNRFPGGMNGLASYIKSLGLEPGLWLAPQGQSNPKVVADNPGVFILKNDTSASKTWEGLYLVDPSSKAGLQYLKNLFTTLSGWGYNYFKIDGQPLVIDEYHSKWKYMAHPSDNADSLYRATIKAIRSAIGNKRYLLGCWGIPFDGIGIMNGSRTGGDVELGWTGFKTALDATMQYYFLNNIVWYCDPDVMLLRYPLTLDQARAWATLQGLTGEALMASDRMMDLSSDRVRILKSVFPALNIRPLDLFPSKTYKHIWDLKINHLGKSYDVVGLFNYNETKTKTIFLKWSDLGYNGSSLIKVFDFWNKEYLGTWKKGMSVTIDPTSCRVLTLLKDDGNIQLISTNRHITQGYLSLKSVKYDENTKTFRGVSEVVGGNPYEIFFAFPRGKNFKVSSAKAGNLTVKVYNHQGWAEVKVTPNHSGAIHWEVSFVPTYFYSYNVQAPSGVSVAITGLSSVNVHWPDQYELNDGFEVYLDNGLVGYTPTTHFLLTNLDPRASYKVNVYTVWENGHRSSESKRESFNISKLLPDQIPLSNLEPDVATSGWGSVQMNKSVSGSPITIAGKQYESGIGTHANSEIEYDLEGLYQKFSAVVGLDDNSGGGEGSVLFSVYGDGNELWHSGVMAKSSGSLPVSVDIKGIKNLVLKVKAATESINYDHADWADAKLEDLIRQ